MAIQSDLEKTVRQVVLLEDKDEYKEAKKVIKKRNDLRKELKDSLKQKKNIPQNSIYFAALVNAGGRINWKDVAYALKSKYDIPEKVFDDTTNEYFPKSQRLAYGRRRELDGEDPNQLKFEFVTPESPTLS